METRQSEDRKFQVRCQSSDGVDLEAQQDEACARATLPTMASPTVPDQRSAGTVTFNPIVRRRYAGNVWPLLYERPRTHG